MNPYHANVHNYDFTVYEFAFKKFANFSEIRLN